MYPVHAQVKKPLALRFDANDEAKKAFPIAKRFGVDVDYMVSMRNPEYAWQVINDPAFVDAVEAAGHDGLMINEGGYKTYGVFDPRKIKSATGNRGTYDTNEPDITKAAGGAIHMDEGGAAFYPRVGNIKAKNFKSAKPMPFVEDPRAMDLPMYGDLSVPTKENLEMARRMAQRDADLKRQQEGDRSPLERLAGGVQAGRFLGSALTQGINAMPTRIAKGDEAADKFMQERLYKPEQPTAYEYAGDVGDFLEKLETEYKIPPVLPEAMALQYLTGPAASQAKKAAGRGAQALEKRLDPLVTQALERGGLQRDLLLGLGQGAQANVVKPKGGNWLTGSVEKSLEPLKGRTAPRYTHINDEGMAVGEGYGRPMTADELQRRNADPAYARNEALNNWVDSNLGGYIKNDMGSPEDPLRLYFDRRANEIDQKFAKDMTRVSKVEQKAADEPDPRRKANFEREAERLRAEAIGGRDFAREHITHKTDLLDQEAYPYATTRLQRKEAGFPEEGMAEYPLAKAWETAADEAIAIYNAGDIQGAPAKMAQLEQAKEKMVAARNALDQKFIDYAKLKGVSEADANVIAKGMPYDKKAELVGDNDLMKANDEYTALNSAMGESYAKMNKENPWIGKVDPKSSVYSSFTGDLGFDHIMDVLREDLATGRIRPEQMNKISITDAVRRTAQYDQELAKKMNESRAAARADLPVYKDYPEGYKWVELNKPGSFANESEAMGHSVRGYEPPKGHPDWVEGSGDSGSSSYGHGGWEAIKSGKAKVYSLVGPKGAPHTTIEVGRGEHPIGYGFKGARNQFPDTFEYNRNFDEGYPRLSPEQNQAILNRAKELHGQDPKRERMDAFQSAADEVLGALPAKITQIKGKQNRAPNEEYLPYVQDFVKSGQWSDVGDLGNTGLKRYKGNDGMKYVTPEEYDVELKKELGLLPPPEGMARGGEVHMGKGGLPGAAVDIAGAVSKASKMADEIMVAQKAVGKKGDLSKVRNESRAADDAMEAKRLAFEAANPPIKASEAYGQHEGSYLKPIFYDRMKVDLSKRKYGGPGFSGIQLVDPGYANAAAGVTDQKMATRILNRNKALVPEGANVIWTPSVGGLEQHKSNSTMFSQFADIFASQRKNMSEDEIQKLSDYVSKKVDNNGRLIFPNGIDLGSNRFRQQVKTYDQRALMADVFAGRGVGGEKGRTVPVEKLLEKNLDPNMAEAGTLDLGNRLFKLEGDVMDRPDLHSDYRKILTGEDLNVNYLPVPIRDVYSDWEAQKKMELLAQGKNRDVMQMDFTKNDPTVQLTEKLLTELQKRGYKEGGEVHKADGGKIAKGVMGALEKASKAADAILAERKALSAAERDANLGKFLEKSKVKNKAYHATNQDFKSFDPKLDARTENKSNIAGWFAGDPEFANDFASQRFRYWKTQHKPWEQDPNVPFGVNIAPVHLAMENPFYATDLIKNLSAPLDMGEAASVAKALGVGLDELLGSIPKTVKYKASGKESEHMPRGFDLVKSEAATDAMKRMGHDGVIALENQSEVYAPFRDTQIKSAIGNRGTYDIEDPDITKAEGGLIREQRFDGGGLAAADFVGGEDDGGSLDKAKLMAKILADMAKEQGSKEAGSLSKPRALTDLLNRGVLANNPLSAGVDLFNMGLSAVGMGSEKPFLGSEHVKGLMDKYGVTSGEDRPMMETALSFASPASMIKGAIKAPSAVNKAAEAFASSKITPSQAKTAQAGKPTGATYATKQEGPFFRVSPTNLDTSAAKTRGIKEADGLRSSTPLGGGAESTGREVPKLLSSEEVGRIIADPVANEPLNIAKKYTQDTQGVDFGVPQAPSTSLAKQSGIARTFDLAVQGSPEYKSSIFDAYSREMPELMQRVKAKNYDDLMEKAYRQMAKETDEQFQRLPYNFSYHRTGEGNYNGAKDMASDVHGNKHLYVYQGGDKHDFLHNVDPQSGLNENEKFRAVHDLLGHAIYGNEFGPKGEEMAWAVHQQMYSPLARMAMTAETRGQNSVVNYSPLNAKLKQTIAEYERVANEARRRGDKALVTEIANLKREAYAALQYAPNKAVLLPPEFMSPQFSGGMPDYLAAANKPTLGTYIPSPLTHFSNRSDLEFVDPKRYGTGIKGAEAERLQDPSAVRDRSYFYMGEPGTVSAEPGLGVNRYRGEASSLYDITQDPLNFQVLARESNRTPYTSKYNQGVTSPLQDANDIERLVKEYGYEGMANPLASKPMAIMFKETPVRRQARGGLSSIK
jgi:hypothetical protein